MIIRGMNLSLIIACIAIILALIILPLIVSYQEEKKWKIIKMSGIKLKNMGIKLTARLEKDINRKDEKNTTFSINHSIF